MSKYQTDWSKVSDEDAIGRPVRMMDQYYVITSVRTGWSLTRMATCLSETGRLIEVGIDGLSHVPHQEWEKLRNSLRVYRRVNATLAHAHLNPRDAPLIQMLTQMAEWMIVQEDNSHGCLTGDCPHRIKSECNDQLVREFLSHKHGDLLSILNGDEDDDNVQNRLREAAHGDSGSQDGPADDPRHE